MKLVRFQRLDLTSAWGLLTHRGLLDPSPHDPMLPTSIPDLLTHWPHWRSKLNDWQHQLDPIQPLRWLCPVDRPEKVLCIGLNYRKHAIETNMAIPTEPIVFAKAPSALIGPDETIQLPAIAHRVDFEAELVIVIGSRLRGGSQHDAHQAIFGYTVGNDISARDWQIEKPGKQWFLGKSFDTFAPVGPAITLAADLPSPDSSAFGALHIGLTLNGESMQNSTLSDMIFNPIEIVHYLAQIMTLTPGDLIFTGTPSGVGMARNPTRFLRDRDALEVSIESIGILCNPCAQEPS